MTTTAFILILVVVASLVFVVRLYVSKSNQTKLALEAEKNAPPEAPGVLLSAKGVNGKVELLENKIRIKREGVTSFITLGLQGDKEIFLKHISSIQFKSASSLTNGYIRFAFLGGQESKGGLLATTQDENAVMFSGSQQPSFEAFKAETEKRMS